MSSKMFNEQVQLFGIKKVMSYLESNPKRIFLR